MDFIYTGKSNNMCHIDHSYRTVDEQCFVVYPP